MTNEVLETDEFSKMNEKCETIEREWIEGIKNQLRENLYVGKILRFSWFREKKLLDKRVYYLINEKTQKAILVAISTKKEQQRMITNILLNKERYLRVIS